MISKCRVCDHVEPIKRYNCAYCGALRRMDYWDSTTAMFNRFTLEIPIEAISDCSHQGQCDEDVEFWHKRCSFAHITDEDLSAELKEYGIEIGDREHNEQFLLWIACCIEKETQ